MKDCILTECTLGYIETSTGKEIKIIVTKEWLTDIDIILDKRLNPFELDFALKSMIHEMGYTHIGSLTSRYESYKSIKPILTATIKAWNNTIMES